MRCRSGLCLLLAETVMMERRMTPSAKTQRAIVLLMRKFCESYRSFVYFPSFFELEGVLCNRIRLGDILVSS